MHFILFTSIVPAPQDVSQGSKLYNMCVQPCSYLQTQAQVRLRGSAAFKEPDHGHGLGHGLDLGLDAFLLLRQQQIPPFISLAGYISPIIYPFKQIQSLKTYATSAHVLNTTLYAFISGRSPSNTANLLNFSCKHICYHLLMHLSK